MAYCGGPIHRFFGCSLVLGTTNLRLTQCIKGETTETCKCNVDLPEPISYVSCMSSMSTSLTPCHPFGHFENPLSSSTLTQHQLLQVFIPPPSLSSMLVFTMRHSYASTVLVIVILSVCHMRAL